MRDLRLAFTRRSSTRKLELILAIGFPLFVVLAYVVLLIFRD